MFEASLKLSCVQGNDLDKAVELLGAALQTRIQAHGGNAPLSVGWMPVEGPGSLMSSLLQTSKASVFADLAPKCASAYHHYGTAIFYKAQEEQDVFGAPLQQAAEEQEDDEEEPGKRGIAATGE